jgi:hypothetical protein
MKARRPMPRDQVAFMIVLILLSVLTIVLWFMDPSHQPSGHSRIDWPPAQPGKP